MFPMPSGIVRLLVTLALLIAVFRGSATAAVVTTQSKTFMGAAASLQFPGGVPQCDTSTKAVDVLALPATTLAPASAATQLAWTPSGTQSSAYEIAVIDPSGKTAVTWSIGVNSKDQVSYFKADALAGAWSFHESGLPSSSCSTGTLMGSPGTASGTASWYQ